MLSNNPIIESLPVPRRRKGSLLRSLSLLLIAILAMLTARWLFFEPYVIPSGSMIPNLLIHDHILVNKMAFGVRVPFEKTWLIGPFLPHRGEIVVFRAVENEKMFMVKRVIGLPGDRIRYTKDGELFINDESTLREREQKPDSHWTEDELGDLVEALEFRHDEIGNHKFTSLLRYQMPRSEYTTTVPAGRIFFMGDNRDSSRDSRSWGTAPVENLLGEALFVWLSCTDMLPDAPFVCDPNKLRWWRFLKDVNP
jgi:signal peptidase I